MSGGIRCDRSVAEKREIGCLYTVKGYHIYSCKAQPGDTYQGAPGNRADIRCNAANDRDSYIGVFIVCIGYSAGRCNYENVN